MSTIKIGLRAILILLLAISSSWACAQDAAEAEAVAAHRAKAAAVREVEQAKAEKAARQGKAINKAVGGLLEQVIGQFRAATVAPPPPPPAIEAQRGVNVQGGAVAIVLENGQVVMQAAGPNAQQLDADGLNPAEAQTLQQVFAPLVDRELAFVRKVCGLDDVQFKALSEALKLELKNAAHQYLKSQQQPRRVVVLNGVRRIEPPQALPNDLMEKSMTASVAKIKLPEDKVAAYQLEISKRAEFRQQAGIEAFVAAIDDRVMLDAAQRDKLRESLAKNWDKSWAPYVESLLHVTNFNPPVPNEILLPLLRQDQKDVWQTPAQNGRTMIINGGVFFDR